MLKTVEAPKQERKQFSVSLKPFLVERLDLLAENSNRSRSNLIEDVLEKYVTGRLVEKK